MIIVGVLRLLFHIFGNPDHRVRAKEVLVNVRVHCLAGQAALALLYVNMCICVCNNLQENVIHRALSVLHILH